MHAYRYWYGGGSPWDDQPTCPLCWAAAPTQRMHGTDRRICADCSLDRPVELLVAEGVPA